MAWVKALHIISIVFWSASLIYLPLLMAEHTPRLSNPEYLRLHGMIRKVYTWVASPFAIAAIATGTTLIPLRDVTEPWFVVKLLVVTMLAFIHARCGIILAKQSHSAERATALVRVMRVGVPVLLFPCVLWLVLAKPRLPEISAPAAHRGFESSTRAHGTRPPLPLPALQRPASRPTNLLRKPAAVRETIIPAPTEIWRRRGRTSA